MWDYIKSCTNTEQITRNKENENRAKELLSSFFDTFYKDVDKPIIIDREKNWGTTSNINLIKDFVTPNPKIIFTVRNILEIIATFIAMDGEYLKINTANSNPFLNNYRSHEDSIAEYLMQPNGDIDRTLSSLASAFHPENNGMFHIVEYNDLVLKPEETMSGIYEFLELPEYKHNFNKIEKLELDNDEKLGLPSNLHSIRESLSNSSTSTDILSEYIRHKYSNMEFWKDDSLMKVKGKDF